jgi:hypothetical protein
MDVNSKYRHCMDHDPAINIDRGNVEDMPVFEPALRNSKEVFELLQLAEFENESAHETDTAIIDPA